MSSELDPLTLQQLAKEAKLIPSFKSCHLRRDFRDLKTIKSDLIKQNLENEFYDAELLAKLFCVFDVIAMVPLDNDEGFQAASKFMHALFTNLRRIGAESENGNAIIVGIRSTKDVLIFKTPKRRTNDELFHEYFVGVTATNALRKLCPNFSYILGAFKCLPPAIAEDKKVTSWCEANHINEHNAVNYVIYEKVVGDAIESHMETCTAVTFFSWFIQITIALHLARDVEFTHYDLHNGNVLARPVKEGESFAIPYEVQPNLTWYVNASSVAQIIDYGMSHVKVDGQDFGKYGLESWGIHADQYRPIYDVYKFLGFSLNQMEGSGNPAAKELLPIWRILKRDVFGETNLGSDRAVFDAIAQEYDSLYALPEEKLELEENYTLWDFLQAMKSERAIANLWSQVVSLKPPQVETLGCGDYCPTPNQIEESIGGTPLQRVKKNLQLVTKGKNQKERGVAMSSLPGDVISLRRDMSKRHNDLMSQMSKLNVSGFGTIPNTVTSNQFQDFIAEYVEPFMHTRDQLVEFEGMKSVLKDYYVMKGGDHDLSEYEFGDEHYRWVKNWRSLQAKVNNLIVPAKAQVMQDRIVNLLA